MRKKERSSGRNEEGRRKVERVLEREQEILVRKESRRISYGG